MLSVRYFEPIPALRQHVSSLYWFESRLPVFADTMRAELGQIRLVVEGNPISRYIDQRERAGNGAILQGPTTAPTHYYCEGTLTLFGIGLLPLGWAELIGVPADQLANSGIDLESVIAPGIVDSLMDALATAADDATRYAVVTKFLLARLSANRHPACWFTRLADGWLTDSPSPQVDALVAASGMSSRSVERFTDKLYGASPKLLARKYRALGAAVRLGLGEATSWSEAAGDAFYDQAHFIRELRAFTGLTPSRFRTEIAPLTRLTMTERRQLPGLPRLVRIA